MRFQTIEFLYLLLPLGILWFVIKNKQTAISGLFNHAVLTKITVNHYGLSLTFRLRLILVVMLLVIVTLARPQITKGEIKIVSTMSDIIIALDMSKSMLANDIYPTRFGFAKNKLLSSLDKITNMRIAILGFSDQSFLVSPLTSDLLTLKFLLKNLSISNLNLKGTDVLSVLQSTTDLFDNDKQKSILLLTDGGESSTFSETINYAKDNNIRVFIYDISTIKGGVIKDKNGVLKDDKNNIVIVKSNQKINRLALQTDGKYLKYSLKNDDLQVLIKSMKGSQNTNRKNTSIKQTQELFYYPALGALILIIIAFFSLPRKV